MAFHGEYYHGVWFDCRKRNTRRIADTVKRMMKELKLAKRNTSLIGAGVSGSLVVPRAADILEMDFALVRSSGSRPVNGRPGAVIGRVKQSVIFVDDLIARGRTIKRVKQALRPISPNCVIVGVVLLKKNCCGEPMGEWKIAPGHIVPVKFALRGSW